jgi:serine/threonine protein kinase
VVEISKYAFENLRTDGELNLYRGRGRGKLRPILVVAPVLRQPDPEAVRRLQHEYSLLEGLDLDCAPKPLALIRHEGRTMLVLEDPDPDVVGLDRLSGQPMELGQFLRIATNLAAGLGELHRRGLIHKDIKPAHILVDPTTDKVWFIGFGIASQLPREHQILEPPEIIAGTLAYMAPEQTGRMNRSIDSRSDLYSLGIALYQMLTGSLPFIASEPIEWRVDENSLSPQVQQDLLRIGQEAISNALRHAQPTEIRVSLRGYPSNLLLRVTDNGNGLARARLVSEGKGFSFANMRARAKNLGARLDIQSKPGHGTSVIVCLPLSS